MDCSPAPQHSRQRFRSFRYSVSRKGSQPVVGSSHQKDSLINVQKLGEVLRVRESNQQLRTLTPAEKEDLYVRTYTTFFSRDYLQTEDKENIKFKALIPEYDHAFDQAPSDFTLLDPMTKPLRFIQDSLYSAEKELKRQRNDIEMLRAQLRAVSNGTKERLSELTACVEGKLWQLKEQFRRGQVQEQQRRLRQRREMGLLERGHELSVRTLESLKERNLQVQERIFSCHPLELQFEAVLEIDNEYL